MKQVALLLLSCVLLVACSDSTQEQPTTSVKQAKEIVGAELIANPQPTEKPKVVEFFAYFCPHCYSLEPYMETWLKKRPKVIEFERIPVTFGRKEMRIYAKAYYIAQMLGIEEQAHTAIFERFHKQKQPISNLAQVKDLLLSLGADAKAFDQAADSDELSTKVEYADNMSKEFQIRSVPSFVVNGQYLTNESLAGAKSALTKRLTQLARD